MSCEALSRASQIHRVRRGSLGEKYVTTISAARIGAVAGSGGRAKGRLAISLIALCVTSWFSLLLVGLADAADGKSGAAVLSAVKTDDTVVIESKGGTLTYKAMVDAKAGGNITEVRLPADGDVIARELNDIFFAGAHGEEFTLRGWTNRIRCHLACSVDLLSQKPEEVVVRVNLQAAGTFKFLGEDETAKVSFRLTHVNYTAKTVEITRTYKFTPDRVVVNDEILWVYPDMQLKTLYFTSAFMPGQFQGPAKLVNGTTTASFAGVSSSGEVLPEGIAYPFTAENFLKNQYRVSLRTKASSFDLSKCDMYFYERAWQQDWHQVSGFMFRLPGVQAGKPVTMTNEIVFSKATAAEMPPIVTIQSELYAHRFMDEVGELPKYKIGDTLKFDATAINSDGSPVPAKDITWELHIDPWRVPVVELPGAKASYTLPEPSEADKIKSKDRKNYLAVFRVKAKGKNGTEAVEPFSLLIGKGEK